MKIRSRFGNVRTRLVNLENTVTVSDLSSGKRVLIIALFDLAIAAVDYAFSLTLDTANIPARQAELERCVNKVRILAE